MTARSPTEDAGYVPEEGMPQNSSLLKWTLGRTGTQEPANLDVPLPGLQESRMREIRTSGSMRGAASPPLLYPASKNERGGGIERVPTTW